MHDCRAVEVYIFHKVGELFVLLSGNGCVPGSRPQASSHALSSEGRWSPGPTPPRLRAVPVALDSCARFYLLLNHFDLGREKEIELF